MSQVDGVEKPVEAAQDDSNQAGAPTLHAHILRTFRMYPLQGISMQTTALNPLKLNMHATALRP